MASDKSKQDVVVVDAVNPDGTILARRFEETESGETKVTGGLYSVTAPGEPAPAGSLKLEHRHGNVYDAHRLGGGDGPAQVANAAYRSNYDRIFGEKKSKSPEYLN